MEALDARLTDDPAKLAQAPPAPPCTLVIFGAGGDLTKRLLMPALYNLSAARLLGDTFSVIGVDRIEGDDDTWRKAQSDTVTTFVSGRPNGSDRMDHSAWDWLCARLHYMAGDIQNPHTYDEIRRRIDEIHRTNGLGCCVFYLAVADRFFGPVVDQLAEAKLLQSQPGRFRRVVIEKPFGHDLNSARELNTRILRVMSESQIYRIDHFLGKETVQNIMAFRFSNGLFEPIWRRDHIDHVQITAAETVGVETRARFYESTGALRDMVPNHMVQLLAMTAMEAPNSFSADAVRAEKGKVIEALHPFTRSDATRNVVRAQYGPGSAEGRELRGYREEPGVSPNSTTETYVALKLGIDNWRWAGVPFYIRTGKRLNVRKTQIDIHFKQAPYALFRNTPVERLAPNVMTLHIQPHEGISLQFTAKVPGPVVHLGGVTMDFRYADYFQCESNTGYETLLYDIFVGDQTLFQRADNVEDAWRAVQPVLDAWAEETGDLHFYPAGSAGPREADELLLRDGRYWAKLA